VLLMPVIAYRRGGHLVNLAVFAVLTAGLIWFSYASWAHDSDNADYRTALQAGEAEAHRVKGLIGQNGGIPPTGALSLLRSDPQTQGPRLWKQQCAVCHDYTDPREKVAKTETPTAPDLAGFGCRTWIAGLLDAERIKSPAYLGSTRFAAGMMVRYVEGRFSKLTAEDREAVIDALAAESLVTQPADKKVLAQIEKGRKLIADKDQCVRCHHFHDAGQLGVAPDLTGYGSRPWLLGVLADPAHSSFYGPCNDRMPAYVPSAAEPKTNRLQPEQIGLVADWLLSQRRGSDSLPSCCVGLVEAAEPEGARPAEAPVLFVLGQWEARRMKPEPPPAGNPAAQGLAFYKQAHCDVCHAHTGTQRADIRPPQPSAPDLGGFASREWIAGLLDPKQVAGPKYYGTGALRKSPMVDFVRNEVRQLDPDAKKDLAKLVVALAAEAERDAPADVPAAGKEAVALVGDLGCTGCHKFYDKGSLGKAPDLTGYGSRAWIAGVLADPGQARFFGAFNDGMPSYRMFPKTPGRNLKEQQQIERLAEWLRGK
jgi:mono/diheme cytochrome c family protein